MKPKHLHIAEAQGSRDRGVLISGEIVGRDCSIAKCCLGNVLHHAHTLCSFFVQLRNPFPDQASSLNGGSEEINQQNLLKFGVFLKIHSLYS